MLTSEMSSWHFILFMDWKEKCILGYAHLWNGKLALHSVLKRKANNIILTSKMSSWHLTVHGLKRKVHNIPVHAQLWNVELAFHSVHGLKRKVYSGTCSPLKYQAGSLTPTSHQAAPPLAPGVPLTVTSPDCTSAYTASPPPSATPGSGSSWAPASHSSMSRAAWLAHHQTFCETGHLIGCFGHWWSRCLPTCVTWSLAGQYLALGHALPWQMSCPFSWLFSKSLWRISVLSPSLPWSLCCVAEGWNCGEWLFHTDAERSPDISWWMRFFLLHC